MYINENLAITLLKRNEVVSLPTETVYGLFAAIDSDLGIQKIFSTKKRPFFDPLIVHVSSLEMAKSLTTDWTPEVEQLAKYFWPGPLTLVLKKSHLVSGMITSGLPRVGIRMPNHPIALRIIQSVNVPLAGPSANKFGRTSPSKAEHVEKEFFDQSVPVIDGGQCQIGIESTVLFVETLAEQDLKNVLSLKILRPGAIHKKDIVQFLNSASIQFSFFETEQKIDEKKIGPGMLLHHYMPDIPLVIIEREFFRSETEFLALINQLIPQLPDRIEEVTIQKPNGKLKNGVELKLNLDPSIAARELYDELRSLSGKGNDFLYFIKEDHHASEYWEGVIDRITKASSLKLIKEAGFKN
jgi:L-threonylcarbamoyladenylate synthase